MEENVRRTVTVKGEINPDLRPGALHFNLGMIYALASASTREDRTLNPADRDLLVDDYAARAVRLLREAHAARYFLDPGKLRMLQDAQELNSLRQRPDFQQFMARVTADVHRANQ
jgi:hypothetical protein